MIDVALAVGYRGIKKSFGNLAFVLPALMFPVIFFVGFAGALSGVDQLPGFDYAPGYETFQFGFVMLQSAAMAGVWGRHRVAEPVPLVGLGCGNGRRKLACGKQKL